MILQEDNSSSPAPTPPNVSCRSPDNPKHVTVEYAYHSFTITDVIKYHPIIYYLIKYYLCVTLAAY